MKGLLRKDWYVFLKYGKLFSLFIFVYSFFTFFTDNPAFYCLFCMIMSVLLVKMLMAYEEQEKWDSLAACFPMRPEQVVLEKYLVALLLSGAMLLLMSIEFLGIHVFFPQKVLDSSFLQILFLMFCVNMLMTAIELPLMFRFGVNRSRIWLTILVMAVFGIGSAIGAVLREGVVFWNGPRIAPVTGTIVLSVIALSLSLRFSVAAYKKREF